MKQSSLLHFISHGFSTRTEGDDLTKIREKIPALKNKSIVVLKQIHSNHVLVLDENSNIKKDSLFESEGDALVTNQKHIAVGIRTADCVPILLANKSKTVRAAIHAGWKGMVSGIIQETLKAIHENFKLSDPTDFVAAIGPCLCQNCFEVGPEVVQNFQNRFPWFQEKQSEFVKPGRQDRSHLNLRAIAKEIFLKACFKENQIDVSPDCTRCQPSEYFSYRAGDTDGRQLSLISL